MSKTAIIWGCTGQDGSHLADYLLGHPDENYRVVGVARRSSTDTSSRIRHLLDNPQFKLVEGDITDVSSVMGILSSCEDVDEIYNLAAQSHVATSFKQPAATWDITGKGCLNILQSIVDLKMWHVRFYQASSSEMFGSSYDVDPYGIKVQNEETKFLPQSPYAIAKCAAHHAVRLYREAYGLHASAGILFNHEGPRRGDNFVTKKITNWVVDFVDWMRQNGLFTRDLVTSDNADFITLRETSSCFPKLRLGNLDAYRDWGYAGDFVEAMWLMLQQDNADDYVICTGQTHTIRDFLDIAFDYVGISNWDQYVVTDSQYYRPAEVDYLRGDASKAREQLGWKPKHDLVSLVALMVDGRRHEKLQNAARHLVSLQEDQTPNATRL